MPIFEFRCEDCGQRFDAFFRHAEEADEKEIACSKCGSGRVRKLFSVIGLGGAEKGSTNDQCGTRST
jgi:putative FmdB family regulatory protein